MRANVRPVVAAILVAACAPTIPRLPAAGDDAAVEPPENMDASAAASDRHVPDAAREAAAVEAGGMEAPAPEVTAERDAAAGARPPRPGELAIDEILIDPAGTDLGREWIEVASLADEPLDLSLLHVGDATGDVAVDAGTLPARGLTVLGQSADPAHNGGAPVDRAYGTRLILNNDADQVALCLGPCADGILLAAFAWNDTLGPDYAGRAVVIDRGGGGICPATEPFGSEGSLGTPGVANAPCATADGGPSP
jgi:hypothetical protein